MRRLVIDVVAGDYAVTRFDPGTAVAADLFTAPGLVSVTSTPAELSVVAPTSHAPGGGRTELGWRLLTVRGPLEFTLTGIMASLAGSLAAAGVSLFALSTFDTDHILVHDADLTRAVTALREAGHEVHHADDTTS
ncbi:ACT domain-containing protein [Actinokineospora sp. NBRC 105648]|uniref:ACT domain-containing protein n=1 Tax=Actinokineospora sp. NBRC 105648 TaxID=3032206 RepID=UPI0024A0079F|nr:ACT domain-containing protein [Actinokineospora sp. NBRC 105648]GLZ40142.1 amino acid-binding protein [Actinokineospora sp. NBRC 105648]